jgi:hypothetical protein
MDSNCNAQLLQQAQHQLLIFLLVFKESMQSSSAVAVRGQLKQLAAAVAAEQVVILLAGLMFQLP